ncbi:hypothetical protein SEA_KING2_71 [Arthrobacter phage King2]|uniref:Uncharacterized protein n=1 Tax=Arthrobacter phage King2 TaxID=2762386 RepID=A0A7G8LQW9_9CAUD|nr:hypothetical protein SEA_KING2_71 [Arthrobacter phage King2]
MRYFGTCINGHALTGVYADTYAERSNPKRRIIDCACGSRGYVKVLDVVINETKCGARCTNATSSKCHCECGGVGHGGERIAFA